MLTALLVPFRLTSRRVALYAAILFCFIFWLGGYLPNVSHGYSFFHSNTPCCSPSVAEPTRLTSVPLKPIDHQPTRSKPAYSPFEPEPKPSPWAKIGKVTVLYYVSETKISRAYERALLGHSEHNTLHGYPHFVLRHALTLTPHGKWSKQAYLLGLLTTELAKPEEERLDWLLLVSLLRNLYGSDRSF